MFQTVLPPLHLLLGTFGEKKKSEVDGLFIQI